MKIKLIILLILASLLAAGLLWDVEPALRLFYLAAAVTLLGFLWTFAGTRGITADVQKLPDRCQVGNQLEESVTVQNNSKLPKFLITVEEKTDIPEYHNITALNLMPGEHRSWRSRIHCTRRGLHNLGSFVASANEPLGLFTRQRSIGQAQSIIVYPATVELPFFSLSSGDDSEYALGQRSINQISPEAATVREFMNGDSPNHIHWRSTAHAGKLMVKTFDADRSHSGSEDLWIVLDMHRPVHAGEGGESTEEYGVTVAASLVMKYLDEGMRVGLIAAAEAPYVFLPDRGEIHVKSLLEALALMRATGQTPIDQLLLDNTDRFRTESTIIVITPSAPDNLVPQCWHLKSSGKLTVAVILDAASFNGTVNPLATSRSLFSIGIPAYVVRKGDSLSRVLDSRVAFSHGRFA